MNSKKLINNLYDDFIELADNYDNLFQSYLYEDKFNKDKLKNIKEIYMTDEVMEFFFPYYFDNTELIERHIGDNNDLRMELLSVLVNDLNRPIETKKINDKLIKFIMDIPNSRILNEVDLYYDAFLNKRGFNLKVKLSLNLLKLFRQLVNNSDTPTYLIKKAEFYFNNIKDNEYDYYIPIVSNEVIQKHKNYNNHASMVLDLMGIIDKEIVNDSI